MSNSEENVLINSTIYASFKHQILTLSNMIHFAHGIGGKSYRDYVHIAVHGAAFTLQELFYDLGYVDSDDLIIAVKEVLNNNILID